MTKPLVVVGHPELADSVTQAFLKAAGGQLATWHELTTPFDPPAERALLWAADRIILQFPLYWYSAPAIVADWLATVFDDHLLGPHGDRLAGKELGVVVSLGRPLSEFGAGKKQGFTIDEYLRPMQGVARATGMAWLPPFVVSQFAYQTTAQRQRLLIDYQQYLTLPQPSSFAQRTAWLAERLGELGDEPEVNLLREVLEGNQDQLDGLNTNIKMIKEADENE